MNAKQEAKPTVNAAEIWPDKFPILRAGARHPSSFDAAIREIANGVEAGAIRNVVLNDAKFTLSAAAYDAWRKHVSERFFYNGKWEKQPSEVKDLDTSIHLMGLHDVIATSKKVAKTKAKGAAVDAMREFIAEALPLAEAVASLKDKVVKGRAPSTGPSKPENPNKVVKTCPCCFRSIAVVRGTMAHHGYERPGHGWQTASCPGIRFKPLEVSNEGLVWLIGTLHETLATRKKAYAGRNKLTSMMVRKGRDFKAIDKTAPEWDREFRFFVSQLESEIRSLKWEIPRLEKRLQEWKPEAQQ